MKHTNWNQCSQLVVVDLCFSFISKTNAVTAEWKWLGHSSRLGRHGTLLSIASYGIPRTVHCYTKQAQVKRFWIVYVRTFELFDPPARISRARRMDCWIYSGTYSYDSWQIFTIERKSAQRVQSWKKQSEKGSKAIPHRIKKIELYNDSMVKLET